MFRIGGQGPRVAAIAWYWTGLDRRMSVHHSLGGSGYVLRMFLSYLPSYVSNGILGVGNISVQTVEKRVPARFVFPSKPKKPRMA